MPKAYNYNNARPTMTYQPKHDRLEGGREGITMYRGREGEGATIGGGREGAETVNPKTKKKKPFLSLCSRIYRSFSGLPYLRLIFSTILSVTRPLEESYNADAPPTRFNTPMMTPCRCRSTHTNWGSSLWRICVNREGAFDDCFGGHMITTPMTMTASRPRCSTAVLLG